MKDHFLKLLGYDKHASHQILDLIIKADAPTKPVALMAHMLAAQQVWLNRCKGLPPVKSPLWPDWEADTLSTIIDSNSLAWVSYIGSLQDEDFYRWITYQTTTGETFENMLSDILTHLINHGTHHRAQIGQHLITAGIEQLPITDYIFYIR
jgi:uncharacterized damage-inducible protein DinB